MNKDSYLILETLPTEYDSRVKAMEVDERPTEQYSDIGGLDKQIQEVRVGVWWALLPSAFVDRYLLLDRVVLKHFSKLRSEGEWNWLRVLDRVWYESHLLVIGQVCAGPALPAMTVAEVVVWK